MPQIDVHLGIDDVLSDAIEQVVRRNRLDETAFVLGAVVAERRRARQFARQRGSPTSRRETNSTQHECTTSDRWSELIDPACGYFSPWVRNRKPVTSVRSNKKDAQREADECDEPRDLNRQADVARAQHRPQCDRKYNNRQQNKDRHRPNRRADGSGIPPHEQRENCSTDRAHEHLAGNCRSNAKLLEMIVTSDLAHERKKRTRRNEDRKAIADNYERCRHSQTSRATTSRSSSRSPATNPASNPAEIAFLLLTMLPILPPAFRRHKRCNVRCPQRILLPCEALLR